MEYKPHNPATLQKTAPKKEAKFLNHHSKILQEQDQNNIEFFQATFSNSSTFSALSDTTAFWLERSIDKAYKVDYTQCPTFQTGNIAIGRNKTTR